jgi:hypothetical protein
MVDGRLRVKSGSSPSATAPTTSPPSPAHAQYRRAVEKLTAIAARVW